MGPAMQRLADADAAVAWLRQRVPGTLRIDSRAVQPGDAFIAWPGQATDGRLHVAAALAAGASACLVEAEGVDAFSFDDTRIAALPALKAACGPIADAWFGQPSRAMALVAITGTNGKTSATWWAAQALALAGRRCAVIGTLGVGEPPALQATGLTTPDPVTLHGALRRMLDQGVSACALEASSIGLEEQRLAGTQLTVAAFTNLSRDHLDYHGTMQAYWKAKRRLFDWPGLRAAVINVDDSHGAQLADELADERAADLGRPRLDVWTVSAQHGARLRATEVIDAGAGLGFVLQEGGAPAQPVQTALAGAYNVSNLLVVAAALRALGVPLATVARVLSALQPVPGRLQRVSAAADRDGTPEVLVDFAHTPDALEKVLLALRPLALARGGRLWCVFGCGGNRDASKRPLMGEIAARCADQVVLTSDNPRDEPPLAILAQILAGITQGARATHVEVIEDRRLAIAHAVQRAAPADVVLLAGKGHEDYQELAGVRKPFSDAEEAVAALSRRPAAGSGGLSVNPPTTMMTLGEALQLLRPAMPSARLVGDAATPVTRVHSDTRTLQSGDLFVALRGERFDAHDFLPQARAAGATAALAERGLAAAGLPGIEVDDALAALQALAAAWRARLPLPLVAVTGSNGKTTVTQMVAAMLHAWCGDAALATAGNLNNHIGVPLTLLRLRATHRVAVLELGMNHPGEIALLARLAAPTVALVNNAQREHQEFMDGVEAVALENGAVIAALPADGIAVFPADDASAALWRQQAGARRCIGFAAPGSAAQADLHCAAQWDGHGWTLALHTPAGEATARLALPGLHNVHNALAAAACALAAGAPLAAVVEGLQVFQAVAGRSRTLRIRHQGRDALLVDDSYNANPDSVRAAIDVLASLPAPRWLLLGDMGEVGTQGPAVHAEVGRHARECGIDALWCAGSASAETAVAYGATARHFGQVELLLAALAGPDAAPAAASVLVKGSRFMRMERVVTALQGHSPCC